MCDDCQRYAKENQELTEEVSGWMSTSRRDKRIIAGLEAELRKVRHEDPQSREVMYVLSEWKALTGHLRAKIDADGDRWKLAARRIKTRGVEDCLLCVRGMALAPFMHFGKYRMTPCGTPDCCVKRDDIADVFGHDGRFEELLDVARRAERAPSDRLWEAKQRVSAQGELLYRLLMDALAREETQKLLGLSLPADEYERRMRGGSVVDLRSRREVA